MSREIKFRGRCAMTGAWRYGYYRKSKYLHIISTEDRVESVVLSETIGQFTGLQDKSGVDIYEGDIVKANSTSRYPNDSKKSAKIIFGSFYQWQVADTGYDLGLPINWGGWESLEVIGNIHESPELLEATA